MSDSSSPSQWRTDPVDVAAGRVYLRYRGKGTRGKPRTSDIDRVDLDQALAAIVRAENQLIDLARDATVIREAMALIDLAARFVADVRKRCTRQRDEREPERRQAVARVVILDEPPLSKESVARAVRAHRRA